MLSQSFPVMTRAGAIWHKNKYIFSYKYTGPSAGCTEALVAKIEEFETKGNDPNLRDLKISWNPIGGAYSYTVYSNGGGAEPVPHFRDHHTNLKATHFRTQVDKRYSN